MFKRLMIGLLTLSLFAIWLVEAYALIVGRRRYCPIETTITCEDGDNCQSYVDLITGVDGLCTFTGTLICNPPSGEGSMAARSNNNQQAARVLVIDRDSIGYEAPYSMGGMDFVFDKGNVGFNDKAKDNRAELPFFATHHNETITLATGSLENGAWFAFKGIPDTWSNGGALPDNGALRRYVYLLDTDKKPDIGFGTRDRRPRYDPQTYLGPDDIPVTAMQPLDTTGLLNLAGQTVCGVVHSDQVAIEDVLVGDDLIPLGWNLQGNYLGVVAFEVLRVGDSSSLPQVEIKILNPDEVCGGLLSIDTTEIAQVEDIPIEDTGVLTAAGDFTANKAVFISDLSQEDGDAICEEEFGPGWTYVKFYIDEFAARTDIDCGEGGTITICQLWELPDPNAVEYVGTIIDCAEVPDCLPVPVLFSQPLDPSLEGAYSNIGGQEIADGFILDTDSEIENIKWYGFYGVDLNPIPETLDFEVGFYPDNDGRPWEASPIFRETLSAQVQDSGLTVTHPGDFLGRTIYEFQINLAVPEILCAGEALWLSIAEDDESTPGSGDTQWLWSRSGCCGAYAYYDVEEERWVPVGDQGDFAFELGGEQVPGTCD